MFYESRLRPRPENRQQRVNSSGVLNGTGLRFAPVKHTGNQSESPEEVERVVELVEGLLSERATWTNKKEFITIVMRRWQQYPDMHISIAGIAVCKFRL
jgi:hypothetical protein